jgi:AraC-like DNA-binding protein
MEIVDSLIFTQAFVWGAIHYRKSRNLRFYLGIAFLLTGLIFISRYLLSTGKIAGPEIFIQGNTVIILTSFLQFILKAKFVKTRLLNDFIPAIILIVSLIILVLTYYLKWGNNFYWGYLSGLGLIMIIYSWIKVLNDIKRKAYSVIWYDDPEIRLSIIILSSLSIVLCFGFVLLVTKNETQGNNGPATGIFYYLVALLLFITGYNSISLVSPDKFLKGAKKTRPVHESVWPEKIRELMQNEKPYLDCELTLGKMAGMLDIDEHKLTVVLNEEMGINFFSLINGYRVETIKKKLEDPSRRKFTIMAAAYESGFNSKSAFYRTFREFTGLTPKEYINQYVGKQEQG